MNARGALIARWLAVFGLLLHMAVPMAHTPPGLTVNIPNFSPAPRAEHAAHDSHHAPHGTDQDAPKSKPGHNRPMQCPICQALQLGGPVLAPAIFVFIAPTILGAVFETAASDAVVERFASPHQARAPPFPIF